MSKAKPIDAMMTMSHFVSVSGARSAASAVVGTDKAGLHGGGEQRRRAGVFAPGARDRRRQSTDSGGERRGSQVGPPSYSLMTPRSLSATSQRSWSAATLAMP